MTEKKKMPLRKKDTKTIYIDEEIYRQFKVLVEKQGKKINYEIEQLIKEYTKKPAQKQDEQWIG